MKTQPHTPKVRHFRLRFPGYWARTFASLESAISEGMTYMAQSDTIQKFDVYDILKNEWKPIFTYHKVPAAEGRAVR